MKYLFIFAYTVLFISCRKENNINNVDIELAFPFKTTTDVDSIGMTYSLDTTGSPWDVTSPYIEVFPKKGNKNVYAMAQGTVENLFINQDYRLQWYVSLDLRFNNTYTVQYQFHTGSFFQNDAQTQLQNFSLGRGDLLNQGDLIGSSFDFGAFNHIKIGLRRSNSWFCSENYMSTQCKTDFYQLIDLQQSVDKLCY